MRTIITSIGVWQAGKVSAMIYSVLALILMLFGSIPLLLGIDRDTFPWELLVMIILYPLLGFLSGIIGAALYNLVARLIGGFEMTIEVIDREKPEIAQQPLPEEA